MGTRQVMVTRLCASEFSAFRKHMDSGRRKEAFCYNKDKNSAYLAIYTEECKARKALAARLSFAQGNGEYLMARNEALKLGGEMRLIRLETLELAVKDARRVGSVGNGPFKEMLLDALHHADRDGK